MWILGSSGGESATVAGKRGLRFAANYHVSPATVLEAVDGLPRRVPALGASWTRPYVSVSADVVVADDEATARELATGYGLWVRSIRTAEGAIPFPTPEQARRHTWTDADRELVADRVDTQFVGSPAQVADQLERLRDATGADELIITTITHDHRDRVRSYQLSPMSGRVDKPSRRRSQRGQAACNDAMRSPRPDMYIGPVPSDSSSRSRAMHGHPLARGECNRSVADVDQVGGGKERVGPVEPRTGRQRRQGFSCLPQGASKPPRDSLALGDGGEPSHMDIKWAVRARDDAGDEHSVVTVGEQPRRQPRPQRGDDR